MIDKPRFILPKSFSTLEDVVTDKLTKDEYCPIVRLNTEFISRRIILLRRFIRPRWIIINYWILC